MPLDFNDDGALGAGSNATGFNSTTPGGGSSAPATDPSSGAASPFAGGSNPMYNMNSVMTSAPPPNPNSGDNTGGDPLAGTWSEQAGRGTNNTPLSQLISEGQQKYNISNPMNTNNMMQISGFTSSGLADGGVVGEDPDDPTAAPGGDDNGMGDRLALALTSVDSALSYGRKLNGLPADSGMDEGGGGQQAANMPMIPGNQSETPGPYKPQPKMAANMPMPMKPAGQSEGNVPPLTPNPGRLSAPAFGKRTADNEPGDGGQPVIPDEEETA